MPSKNYLIVYFILVLFGTVTTPLRFSYAFNNMRRGARNLHRALLLSLSTTTLNFLDTTPIGRILNRFSRDVDQIDDGLQMSILQFCNCLFSILSSFSIMIISQPFVLIALVPCGYVYYRLIYFYNSANREIRRVSSLTRSPLFSLLGEVINGRSTIIAYNKGPAVMKEVFARLDTVFSSSYL
uniref:Multidrug resistance protein n=1 Tax=Lygus hesperus TaxID=30085 RepID=A0A0A9Y927_LYGHE